VELGRYRQALHRLEEAHERIPNQGRIAHALAKLLAASPELELRDGKRALDLALRVFEASPTAGHAQTVASALAELGRCEQAAEWLGRALAGAQAAGQAESEWAQALRKRLARYQQGPPCRDPGSTEDDIAAAQQIERGLRPRAPRAPCARRSGQATCPAGRNENKILVTPCTTV
jgi:tetratricopeptide (TPR) repeat protein